jgi:hypothetical protein
MYFSVKIFLDRRHFLISQPPPSWIDLDHHRLIFKKPLLCKDSPSSPLQNPQRNFKIGTLSPVATMPENTVTVPENVLFSNLLIDAITTTTTTNNQSLEFVCQFFCLFSLYFLYNYIFMMNTISVFM